MERTTEAWTTSESLRIELPYLLRHRYIKKNCVLGFRLNWTNQRGEKTGSVCFKSSYLEDTKRQFLELSYYVTRNDGTGKDYTYKIYFSGQDSNLGKGRVLYFLCPQTGKKCRILYLAYDSEIFKSREAYRDRLYYTCQQASKLTRYNDAFWRIDSHLKKIRALSKAGDRTYKGKPTKAAKRYNRLCLKQCDMDELRWTLGAPKSIRKLLDSADLSKIPKD